MKQAGRLPLRIDRPSRPQDEANPESRSSRGARAILHLDLDAFYAAVEVLEDPSLAGRPILVGGRPEGRGVVATASYAAREYGIHSAMPMARAVRLCPAALILPPRFGLYRRYSRQVIGILQGATEVLEKVSIDEAYLDLTEKISAWREAVEIAHGLQQQVRQEVGLSASIGLATNKLVAKVASDYGKPAGMTVVPPGNEAEFLAPLSVRVLWGIGPVTATKLAEVGVTTVGDLARVSEAELINRFGDQGSSLRRRARGIDRHPVCTEHERKSVSRETTFRRDLRRHRELKQHLWRLSQSVARRLERAGVVARTITIKLRYDDFETLTRQMSLDVATGDELRIYRAALVLLEQTWDPSRAVRLLGVGGDHLTPPTGQLPLL